MKHYAVYVCSVILLALNLRAVEKGWTGGAATNLFSASANWSPSGAPADGDSLLFTNSVDLNVVNDLVSRTFAGITVAGNGPVTFQNTGNGFTLSGALTVSGPRELNTLVPITLGSTVTFALSGANFYAYSPVSGTGGVTLEGGKTFYAKNAVALTNGITANKGKIFVESTGFASPVTLNQYLSNTVTFVALAYLKSGTYNFPITISNSDGSSYGATLSTSGGILVTNTAPITLAPSAYTRWRPDGSMTLSGGIVLQNPVTGDASVIFNGNTVIRSVPLAFTNMVYVDDGTFRFAVASNTYAGLKCYTKTVYTDVPFALDPNRAVSFGVNYKQTGGLDLNGNSQIINRPVIDDFYNVTNSSYVLTSSSKPATLTCLATAGTMFYGSVDGALSLAWEPVGDYTCTLTGRTSQTTGSLQAKGGTLLLASGSAFPNLSGLSASGTGVLRVETAAVNAGAAYALTNSAVLALPTGVALTGYTAQVDGVYLTPGVYSSASTVNGRSFITGSGTLAVQMIPLSGTVRTWTGASGTDTLFSNAANWDSAPAFDGSETFLFSAAGTNATVDGTFRLGALRFNRGTPFTLAPSNTASSLWLGLGGITMLNPSVGSPVTNTVAVPLALNAASEWQVASNLMLAVSGTVSGGLAAAPLVKTGDGTLRLTGTNAFDSPLIISNGFVNVNNGTALGNPTNTITIHRNTSNASSFSLRGALYFNDTVATNHRPIIVGPAVTYIGQICPVGATLVLNGKVTLAANTTFYFYNQGLLIFRGGFECLSNTPWMQTTSGKTTRFEEQPLNLGSQSISLDNYGAFNVCATNNTWVSVGLFKGTFLCGAANVMPTNSYVAFGVNYSPQGFLDLNGYDQQVKYMYNNSYNPANGPTTTNMYVKSATPATLTLQGDSSVRSFVGYFSGQVSLRHRNSGGTLALTAATSASTTAGDLIIEAGTVAFHNGAKWTGSTNITVTAGTLSVEGGNGTTFGGSNPAVNRTRLRLTSSSTVNLSAGVTDYVYAATLNGQRLPVGSYGSMTSTAQYKKTFFTGTGLLYLLRSEAPGTLILMR